jgi:TolB-like protein/Tfp pilus assembly protein PilF
LPGRGYRFIEPVRLLSSQQNLSAPDTSRTGVSRYQNVRRQNLHLAVLPFETLASGRNQEYAADALTDALITELSQIHNLEVVSRITVKRYKGTRKRLPDIAHELSVDLIVAGTMICSDSRIRLSAQLIESKTDRNLWAETYESVTRGESNLLSQVAATIASRIRARIDTSPRRSRTGLPNQSPAYLSYVLGRYFWNKRTELGLKKALACFDRAIAEDPRFAPAYAGLSDCYIVLSQNSLLSPQKAYPRVRAATAKALELDSTLAEAHSSLAYSKMNFEWRWEEAERGLLEAISLNPNCVTAHQWYADYLTARRRHVEALAEIKKAWDLDPLCPMINSEVAWNLCHAAQYEEAIQHYLSVIEMEPNFLPAHWGLGLCYLKKSMFKLAITTFKRIPSLSPASPMMMASLGHAYGICGEQAKARRLLHQLEGLATRRYVPSYDVATVHAGLGHEDHAYTWLQRAYNEREGYLIFLDADPRLAETRSDPRIRKLTNLVGLTA